MSTIASRKVSTRFPRWRYHLSPWSLAAAALVLCVLIPVLVVAVSLLGETPASWEHIRSTVLSRYMMNTGMLVLGIGAVTALVGVSTAWLITFYHFPGDRIFSWALVLPFAFPTYIAAFAYAGIFDYTGPIHNLLNALGVKALWLDIMNLPGAILVVSLVLYPYVYLITRASLQRQSGKILEASRSLGRGPFKTACKAGIPLARPAIVGGLILVTMEVLNEYGAMHYFGVDTFTTGIFKVWFGMNDTAGAMRLAAMLMCLVFGVLLLERVQRGRRSFTTCGANYRPAERQRLRGITAAAAVAACLIPVVLGFMLPLGQLLAWLYRSGATAFDGAFIALTLRSFGLATAAALLTVIAAVFIVYAVRLHRTPMMTALSKASALGYSMPGAVIAIGVMVTLVALDRSVVQNIGATFSKSPGLLLSGTVVALLFAYIVRFLAVAVNPVESGFDRLCGCMDEASLSMGKSRLHTLLRINIPLARGTLLAAAALVFVDVLKELPLTLILRPFNFETLATKTFELAGEEMVAQSACGALLIVAAGIIPIIVLDRLITGRQKQI
jgi:iron(III) transport system permease protein